jgi:hypothetical protein
MSKLQIAQDLAKEFRRELREANYQNIQLGRKLKMYEEVKSLDKDPPAFKKLHYKKANEEQGTVIALLSDVHGEERITYAQTNHFNRLTPEITKDRLRRFFNNFIKLTRLTRGGIKLDQCVIGLLGDLIHGFIHEEYLRTNYLTPVQASMWMTELLTQGFKMLLEDGEFKNVTVICKVGNHSRTTRKIYSDTEATMSYEWAIYHALAKRFPQFNWVIDESYFTYHKIYNKTVRWHHGHAFRYMGGVGGIYIPLMRFVFKVNRQRRADMDAIGHWHTREFLSSGGVLMNGSVCGATPYSIRLGFPAEPPQQQFQIVDAARGFTINAPIVLE